MDDILIIHEEAQDIHCQNLYEKLVAAEELFRNALICPACHGDKQRWNPDMRMMEDCTGCYGSGQRILAKEY